MIFTNITHKRPQIRFLHKRILAEVGKQQVACPLGARLLTDTHTQWPPGGPDTPNSPHRDSVGDRMHSSIHDRIRNPRKATCILEVERKFRTVGTEGLEMKRPMYTMLGEKCGVVTPLSSAQIPN